MKFYRRDAPPSVPRTELRVVQVTGEAAETWAAPAVTACFVPRPLLLWMHLLVGRPGRRHYVAYEAGQATACGMLYVQDGVGWLGLGGTLRGCRGRGAQSALIARRLADALELGCKLLTVEILEDLPEHSNPSYRNMLRAGFEVAYVCPNYRLDWRAAREQADALD